MNNTAPTHNDASAARLRAQVERLGEALLARGWMLATAESCTGGWVAQAVTAIPGSSRWFERGFVTYSNAAKMEMLGVAADTLARHGAVSLETVAEMVSGALCHSHAQAALAVSGIAGPGGGSPDKPVGTVCLAWALTGRPASVQNRRFPGSREVVRRRAVGAALDGMLDHVLRG
ncbi:MAG TPA: nicotinamide-nucleotide amidohydrolase family protein [Gammaproteobacteria bacterium]|nr:nicotinamide-nucleotide amidohydrolase family protein [Gammaproteobacteria bacterium]